MTKQEIIKEIKRLENKQSRSMKAMYQSAFIRGGIGNSLAVDILKSTEIWNKFSMIYGSDFKPITKNLSKMKKDELEYYLDELQDIDLSPLSTATAMNKFIAKETKALKELKIADIINNIDWEQWLKLYIIPSEYLYSSMWESPSEKVVSLRETQLKPQEPVSPRQIPDEYASKHCNTFSDWEFIIAHATILRSSSKGWGIA